jgi:two-component system response regulator DevR
MTGARQVRIVLVDDHELVRSGMKVLLEREEDLIVVGEAGTAQEAIQRVEDTRPDLVLLDVRLPDRSGISVCQEVRTRFSDTKVLILTAYADEVALASAILAGASGFVLKNVRSTEIVDDIRQVIHGDRVVPHRSSSDDSPLSALSPQERLVARHVAEGLANRQIADRMGLAEKTVKNYVSNVLTKLGVARRSEAAAFVARAETMVGDLGATIEDPRATALEDDRPTESEVSHRR